ncbi:hypothetical protein MCEGE10_02458 [Flavobacteriaceae bacterium]
MGDLEENKFNQKQKTNSDFQSQNQIGSDDALTQHKCQNCGWGCSVTADICENCGDWQLKGKCNFCYADVEEGQKFCAECGNPPEGIICHSCEELSHFDFCPQCNIALTEQANETIEMIANSIEFQNLTTINENEIYNTNEKIKHSKIESEKLKNYLSKFAEQQPKKKNLFTLNDNPNGNVEENLKTLEQSKQSIKTKEQEILFEQQKEIKALKLLEDTRSKTFSSNQEARKFFGALKILLPTFIQIGWRCNAYGCVHNNPQDCADPAKGGTWLNETTFKQTEI